VSYRDLVTALSAPVPAVTTQRSRVASWSVASDGVHVVHGGGTTTAQLLVLADGGAQAADAGRESVKEYGQCAIVCEVETEKPHEHTAWERFSVEGPLALLPFRNRYALVWTSRTASAERLMALDDTAFLAAARTAFGGRLGAFRAAGPRAVFTLSLKHRHRAAEARVLPIGNAAQTLHPVAGQGLNLGLRDAWELAEMIADADRPGKAELLSAAPGTLAFAQAYASRRALDRKALVRLTDGMISAFGLSLPFASTVRGAALAFLDTVPPARRFLSRRMMFGARALP
jgi:2-octaprenyl-6-methoxyphenol hydroxylase